MKAEKLALAARAKVNLSSMNNWQELKSTTKKLNREVIVMDDDGVWVLMPLDRYNSLLDGGRSKDLKRLSKEEFLQEINRQIAEWRASQNEQMEIDISVSNNNQRDNLDDLGLKQDDDMFYIEPVEEQK